MNQAFDLFTATQPPSIQQQTGWKRPYPLAICQEMDVLLKITDYDYDLSDPDFRAYVTARIGYLFEDLEGVPSATLPDPNKLQLLLELDALTDAQYLTTDKLRYAKQLDGSGGGIVPSEKRSLLTRRITRGKYQDCWELYKKDSAQ